MLALSYKYAMQYVLWCTCVWSVMHGRIVGDA